MTPPVLLPMVPLQLEARRAQAEAKRAREEAAFAEARAQQATAVAQRARGAAEVDAKSQVRGVLLTGRLRSGWVVCVLYIGTSCFSVCLFLYPAMSLPCCLQELVAQHRSRIGELEAAAQQLQRQLAAARQQGEALEGRLAAAELAAAGAAAEVRLLGVSGLAAWLPWGSSLNE